MTTLFFDIIEPEVALIDDVFEEVKYQHGMILMERLEDILTDIHAVQLRGREKHLRGITFERVDVLCDNLDTFMDKHFRQMRPIQSELIFKCHKRYFKQHITEELIAESMSPKRVEAEMSHFDDIEAYFEAMN